MRFGWSYFLPATDFAGKYVRSVPLVIEFLQPLGYLLGVVIQRRREAEAAPGLWGACVAFPTW